MKRRKVTTAPPTTALRVIVSGIINIAIHALINISNF
jgi:hypothetical protein